VIVACGIVPFLLDTVFSPPCFLSYFLSYADIIPGTPEEANWRRRHPNSKRKKEEEEGTGSNSLHLAAQKGDVRLVQRLVQEDSSLVQKKDDNGWTALHEGVRNGNKEVVEYLHKNGADLNARTGGMGEGGSVLWWAKKTHGSDHEIVAYLESLGAVDVGPEL